MRSSLLIYVLIIVMVLMNTFVVEIHEMYKIYEIDTVNKLQYFVIIYNILKIL